MDARFLFFSAEAKSPAGYLLVQAIHPIELQFNAKYASKYATDRLENITIVFICTDEELLSQGFYNERRYISWKKKYADIRLQIPYLQFIHADTNARKAMMWDVIERAIEYLRKRNALERIDEFADDLRQVYWAE